MLYPTTLLLTLLPLVLALDNPAPPQVPAPIPAPHDPISLTLYRFNHQRCLHSMQATPEIDGASMPWTVREGQCYSAMERGEGFLSFLVGFIPPYPNATFTDWGNCTAMVFTDPECATGASRDPANDWQTVKRGQRTYWAAGDMQTRIGCQRKFGLKGKYARAFRFTCTGRKKGE